VFCGLAQPSVASEAVAPRSADGAAYLHHQVLAAKGLPARGEAAALDGVLDRTLSLVASVDRPEAAPALLATTVAEVLAILAETDRTERAWGLYRAGGPALARLLPGSGPETIAYRLTEASLLERMGDLKGAAGVLETATTALRTLEAEPSVRRQLLARALSQRAAVCAGLGDLDCARAALAEHPDAALYDAGARAPGTPDEVTYLVVRSLVATLGGQVDPVAAQALSQPLGFKPAPGRAAALAAYRQAGVALALEPGPRRRVEMVAVGERLRQVAWRKSDALDQLLVSITLAEIGRDGGLDAKVAFDLMQIAGRSGHTFDADALAQLSQARDEMGRRTAHQALRLRARRDRLEREQIQKVLQAAAEATPASRVLSHDAATRLLIRDFNVRIARADAEAAKAGVRREPGLAPLARLQAALSPGEAVLAMAPTVGGFAYMCVRKDAATYSVAAGDPMRVRLDARLVQAALTATHAPSERLDIQFPAEASVRLYDAMIRPFESCLKSGDRIVWLSGVAGSALPLSALLSAPPPKVAGGYDLAAADWLVRRHAISYAGSAEAILAARTARGVSADFDFLGVGDPVLRPKAGEDPARLLLRGTRLDSLAPLPETRDELEASAEGFRAARVLLQDAATERNLRGEMVGAYRHLSFATHGLIREDLQGLSEPALVLTPVNAADPADDGLLTASEIADMNLRAAFVVLSACNTANFDLTQFAQDLPALASAFAVAGVPATLATLWPVNSEAGKRVVTDLFASLRETGAGPADALAQAQRRFLAAPPERAYLHPRFWAPFVVLGDGGPAVEASPPAKSLRTVEVLTRAGGEVLDVERTSAGVATQFISDADARGRHGAAVRVATTEGAEIWRLDDRAGGASRFGADFDGRRLVGGYRLGPAGRYVPVVQAYENGAAAGSWQGTGLAKVDAFILAGSAVGDDAAMIAVGELNLRDAPEAGGGRLHVLELTKTLATRPLFTVEAPPGFKLSDATVTPMGGDLLVTYTTNQAPPLDRPPTPPDDYDTPYCLTERVTWLELRDGRTGARKAAREIRGLGVVTALGQADGTVLLGGSSRDACGQEGRATVLSATPRLETRTLYRDDSLGASDVRALAALPGGRTFVAASKENVVTLRRPDVAAAARANPYAVLPFTSTFSGLVVTLDRKGAPSAPTLLDSGSNIYVTAADASRPGDILLGGALAGQAAVFHLSEGGR
jgi:CHAT domain-containing protein